MAAPLMILLPPSEGKAEGGSGRFRAGSGAFGRALRAHREEVLAALAAAAGGDARLLGASGPLLERAVAANRLVAAGRAPVLPARQRYTGVVHAHAGLAEIAPVGDAVVIVSGLLGLVAPDDPVPDYRLKAGASLPPLGRLATWWRPRLQPVLRRRLAGCYVVDLLPQEHAAAFAPEPRRYAALRRVRFVAPDGVVGGHDAKAAKGLLVRHLLTCGLEPDEALATFRHERYAIALDEPA